MIDYLLIFYLFQYKHQLLQHIEYVHATEKIFKCTQCDYAHASQHGLNGHIKYNHPTENDLKVCHICGYKNPSQHNVNKHIQSVHEGQRNHPCNICGHRFVSKHRMEVHVRSIHLGRDLFRNGWNTRIAPILMGGETEKNHLSPTKIKYILTTYLKMLS